MTKKLIAFSSIGGKYMYLDFILPYIDVPHTTYVESFGGSAVVLMNKQKSPVEVYNDIYSDYYNFFCVLRDAVKKDQLIASLELTPYHREEFINSLMIEETDSDVEKARKFFVKAKMVTGGLVTGATPGRFGYSIKDSRGGKSLVVNRWLNSIPKLQEIHERLREIQVEKLDALDVIQRYDTPETLHYCDPPYLMETRSGGKAYKHEMTVEQHEKLLDTLMNCKGKVVISGYDSEMYNTKLAAWTKVVDVPKNVSSLRRHGSAATRTDCIWKNF